jgi:hypothetical protein
MILANTRLPDKLLPRRSEARVLAETSLTQARSGLLHSAWRVQLVTPEVWGDRTLRLTSDASHLAAADAADQPADFQDTQGGEYPGNRQA